MLADKFKSAKTIEIEKQIKAYVNKNYDPNSYTTIQTFVSAFVQHRNIVSGLADMDKTLDKLKSYKETVSTYLNMINTLRAKLNFGKDEYCLQMEFAWKDVLKNDYYYSNNINLEYFSAYFNLGVIYVIMGRYLIKSTDDVKSKEGIRHFQNAAWVFDNIKQEIALCLPSKEIPPDLSSNYLSYCSFICLAQAQSILLGISERKNLSFELQAQLCKGISDLYTQGFNLASDSLKKLIDDPTRIYLNYQRLYFVANSGLKSKELWAENFKNTGEGYGKQIALLAFALDCLSAAGKDINKAGALINTSEYSSLVDSIASLKTEMTGKNQRIYFDVVPDVKNLPKVEKLIKVFPVQISEDLSKAEMAKELEGLVPKEIKPLLNAYKENMMEYISSNLDKFENDEKIVSFLAELSLPHSLEAATTSSEISESLWKKISEIQQKGGTTFLTNQLGNLEKKCEEIAKRINDMELAVYNEEQEDSNLRTLYGNKWVRYPSNNLNGKFYGFLNDYKGKLTIAKNCDSQIKTTIMGNLKHFELFNLSKQSLQNKIPVKSDNSKLKNSEEATNLRKDLDRLETLKETCMETIEKIFQLLNDDNLIPQFMKVLQKKTTEKAILTENQAKYGPLFEELGKTSTEIEEIKKELAYKNELFNKVKNLDSDPILENESFFSNLDKNVQLFNQMFIHLQQGSNFYSQLTMRLNELNGQLTDYLFSRDIEKGEIIKSITSGQNVSMAYSTNSNTYLDKDYNLITNLNCSYRYGGNQYNK